MAKKKEEPKIPEELKKKFEALKTKLETFKGKVLEKFHSLNIQLAQLDKKNKTSWGN